MGLGPNVNLTGSADKFVWIYGAGVLIVVLVGIYFLGKSTGKASGIEIIKAEPIKTSNLTYENSQYLTWGDSLFEALKTYFGLGEDASAVMGIMRKMRTNDDVKQLIKACGSRSQGWLMKPTTLNQWLTDAFNAAEMSEMNNILMANNISYTF